MREVLNEMANSMIGAVDISSDEGEGSAVVAGEKLNILLKGVETPDTLGHGDTLVFWDTKNNASQDVAQGTYYIKFESKDAYGHVNTLIKDISVIKYEQYVELKVFNSGGELIRTIKENKAVSDNVVLKVGDVIVVTEGGADISIPYGDGAADVIKWDGLNEDGMTVSNGAYEIQVTVRNNGRIKEATKTVVVLNEGRTLFLGEVKAAPNPYSGETGKGIKIVWSGAGAGRVSVKVYNMAGDVVRVLYAEMTAGSLTWDGQIASGEMAACGVYICVIEAKDETGHLDRKIIKIALLSK